MALSELLCREGLGVYLQSFSGKKDQGTNYETAAIEHSRCYGKPPLIHNKEWLGRGQAWLRYWGAPIAKHLLILFTSFGSFQGHSIYPGGCPGPREGAESFINNHIFTWRCLKGQEGEGKEESWVDLGDDFFRGTWIMAGLVRTLASG